ncbi:Dihydroflavonol 4-reductase [Hondaea fermentalgiana]|uniref:Dihydroflavonol 4-reductase n=1 Tax=Hondaea fermentalgiana TaxID=2315210 RepID=A0A2R5G1G6_9STRA|nr:Dihydroflavonol 4-reductase [Hondaea fermentalgiana]|eukprot:GBG24139.1 Dihydroflavonol 4-reductase [Hondaea fermentalgiana]
MSVPEAKRVCVTGCTGFLGSWIVKYALDAGFEVHGTTRSGKKVEFLHKLEGASERLKLFTGCDLLEKGSFDEAIKGCRTVIHSASPFIRLSDESARDKLVEPAVAGTRNVLESCEKLGVEKVVLTASIANIYIMYGAKPPEYVYTEEDWTDEKVLEEKKNFYGLSKLLAEKTAWEMAKSSSFKLAALNPSFIYGPMLPGLPELNTSSVSVLAYFGAPKIKQANACITDVRDVALAHVNAAQQDLDWKGWGERFLLIGGAPMPEEIVQVLRESSKVDDEHKKELPTELDPKLPAPGSGAPPPHRTRYNVEKSLKPTSEGGLGLGQYRNYKEQVESAYESLIANGFTSKDMYKLDKE